MTRTYLDRVEKFSPSRFGLNGILPSLTGLRRFSYGARSRRSSVGLFREGKSLAEKSDRRRLCGVRFFHGSFSLIATPEECAERLQRHNVIAENFDHRQNRNGQ